MKYAIPCLFLCLSLVSHTKVRHVQNSKQLKNIIDQQPTVIKFSTTWCGPCKMAKKPFKEISNMPEFNHIAFVAIDTDQQQNIANAYNITALPTFVFIRGGSVITKEEGLIGANNVSGFKQNLAQKLNNLFAQQEPAPAEPQKEQAAVPVEKAPHKEPAPIEKTEETVEHEEATKNVLDQISNWLNDIIESISNAFRSLWGS